MTGNTQYGQAVVQCLSLCTAPALFSSRDMRCLSDDACCMWYSVFHLYAPSHSSAVCAISTRIPAMLFTPSSVHAI